MSEHGSQVDGRWGNKGPTPPEEKGERLCTFDRSGSRGEREQLRVSLDTYEGHAYISARMWVAGRNGYWPSAKGITIRKGELATVIAALQKAAASIDSGVHPRRPAGPGADRVRRAVAAMPAVSPEPFDEF